LGRPNAMIELYLLKIIVSQYGGSEAARMRFANS
jgi:hypothetical protein